MARQSCFIIALLATVLLPVGLRAEEPPVQDLLELISLESRIGDVVIPQNHDMDKYVPYWNSSNGDVQSVAVFASYWEIYAVMRHRAIRGRIASTEGVFLAGASLRPPGVAADPEFDFEAFDIDMQARKVGPLQLAVKHGELAPFEGKNFFKRMQQGYELGFKQGIANIMTATHNEYVITAEMAELQDAMWNAAARIARANANTSPLDPNQVIVELLVQPRTGYTVVVHNKSPQSLHNLTLVASGKKTPVQVNEPNGDRLLGGLAAVLSGETDGKKIENSGEMLKRSAAAYNEVLNRPTRVYIHIPELPSGDAWSIVFSRSSMEMARLESTSFWLWTDEGTFDARPLCDLDALREQMRKNAANNPPPNRRAAQPGATSATPFGVLGGNANASGSPKDKMPARSASPSFEDLQNAEGPRRILLHAQNMAIVNLVEAAAQFRQLISTYPKSEEAAEAKEWLGEYPQRLLERAEKFPDNLPGHTQAVRLYKEALNSKPEQAEQRAAKKGLDERAAKILAAAIEMDEAGNKMGAARVYNQLVQDLPASKEATAARARLRKAAAPKKR